MCWRPCVHTCSHGSRVHTLCTCVTNCPLRPLQLMTLMAHCCYYDQCFLPSSTHQTIIVMVSFDYQSHHPSNKSIAALCPVVAPVQVESFRTPFGKCQCCCAPKGGWRLCAHLNTTCTPERSVEMVLLLPASLLSLVAVAFAAMRGRFQGLSHQGLSHQPECGCPV